MTIYRKKNKSGKLTKTWYYDFKYKGQRYSKSAGTTSEAEAKLIEKQALESAKERYEIETKDGATSISLKRAVEIAIEKPSKITRSEVKNNRKRQVWTDFINWLSMKYPKVRYLHQITCPMAEAYIKKLSTEKKYNKASKQKKKNYYTLSASSINDYHKQVEWVFKKLAVDAGLTRNPFSHIEKKKADKVKREAYTDKEIEMIEKNIDSFPFCKHLYYIGTGTGMRMGNICMLGWSDINIQARVINCENRKTGGKLTIPILPSLYKYLLSCGPKADGYVSSVHAETYSRDVATVSKSFTKFLNSIGIETQVKANEGSRPRNIKGVHAMRHTFIYKAMLAKIPINVIQSIVGHADAEITKMYADHVIAEDAKKAMKGFSISGKKSIVDTSFGGAAAEQSDLVNKLLKELSKLPPEKQKQLLEFVS